MAINQRVTLVFGACAMLLMSVGYTKRMIQGGSQGVKAHTQSETSAKGAAKIQRKHIASHNVTATSGAIGIVETLRPSHFMAGLAAQLKKRKAEHNSTGPVLPTPPTHDCPPHPPLLAKDISLAKRYKDGAKKEEVIAALTVKNPFTGKARMNPGEAEELAVKILGYIAVEKCIEEKTEAACPRGKLTSPAQPPPSVPVRVLALQWPASLSTPTSRLMTLLTETFNAKVEEHGPIDVVILPEYFLKGILVPPVCIQEQLEDKGLSLLRSKHMDAFANFAREHKVYVLPGTVQEKVWNQYGKTFYNTAVLIGPNGELVGSYRKRRLTADEYVSPGKDVGVFDTPIGRIGILICSDTDGNQLIKDTLKFHPAFILVPIKIPPSLDRAMSMNSVKDRIEPMLKEA
eukprot:gnl/MRDRNA2_/MRDRNA2_188881_c0_seq1.p1 gnl/MRDRNA2_/MRDRNA2_188881_c0~~gnl/MRDRNA2_/MRDRNA2_188881_c0_seq1.p1  ORF type:complete len:402 (+),score=79.16 gnl/MRDRNA2_/MRDRNA2_188881_c0_seq1:84-1289(+)